MTVQQPRLPNQPFMDVAIIGAGFIAPYHLAGIARTRRARVVAVCDRDPTRAGALAAAAEAKHVFSDVSELLDWGRFQVAHVLVPPDMHASIIMQLLEAGRHVFSEKPLCSSARELHDLKKCVSSSEATLGVGHNFLYYRRYEELRDAVVSGALGPINTITMNWQSELPQARSGPYDQWMLRHPGNIVLEIGAHALSLPLDLADPPGEWHVQAFCERVLPSGVPFFRRWNIVGRAGDTVLEIRLSLLPGFDDRWLHVQGQLGSARLHIDTDTLQIDREVGDPHGFGRLQRARDGGRALRRQARANLMQHVLTKTKLSSRGNSYEDSISRCIVDFYSRLGEEPDRRCSYDFASEVISECERIVEAAELPRTILQAREQPPLAPFARGPAVLVTGGTGFIGREVARELVDAGYSVRVFTRSRGSAPSLWDDLGVDVSVGSLQDPAAVRRALEGARFVVHLAKAGGRTWSEYLATDVLATEAFAQRCQEANVERFVYTSSMVVYYLGRPGEVVSEQTPHDPWIRWRDHYARAKAEAEKRLLELHERDGLPVVVTRPGIVIGPGGDPCHPGVGLWSGLGTCQFFGSGRTPLPFVLNEDVARGLVRCLEAPKVEGQAFNLVGDPLLSARDYVDAVEAAGNVRVRRYEASPWRLYLQDMAKSAVKYAVRHPKRSPPLYREWLTRANQATIDSSYTRKTLDWQPEADRDAIREKGITLPTQEYLARDTAPCASFVEPVGAS